LYFDLKSCKSRLKLFAAALMMKKTKKVRTCQNMSGVLGGANAFNFLSFVSGVITLGEFVAAIIEKCLQSNINIESFKRIKTT
jgi:hypothetical protein